MLDRVSHGDLPRKHHVQLRGEGGALRFEECFTRDGFDGPFSILYHLERPHLHRPAEVKHGWQAPAAGADPDVRALAKRHYHSGDVARGGAPVDAFVPLLHNADLVVGVAYPDRADPVYVSNADGDVLVYVLAGGGVLRSPFGDLRFNAGDYVAVPRSVVHRFLPDDGPQQWFWCELDDLHLPRQWRNPVGQLRMDAPYCHRDFRRPTFAGPVDEDLRDLAVKRGGRWHGFTLGASPLDVVGWDGSVYPWVFPMLAFQPRVSSVHLPPTWHGTFAAKGALVCSFVPRLVDFAPDAIPCPYPHSSPSCDEIIYYCDGNFTSRKGVGPGSVSHHPAGIPHGPHPGAYERSIGATRTDETAVMLDTYKPLSATPAARAVEDPDYMLSFL
jgi:homogentisate 1,2-dioxygenase